MVPVLVARVGMYEHAQWSPVDGEPGKENTGCVRGEGVDFEHGDGVGTCDGVGFIEKEKEKCGEGVGKRGSGWKGEGEWLRRERREL